MRTTVRAFKDQSQAPASQRIRLDRGPESGRSEDQIHVPVSNSVRLQWGQESSPSQVKRQAILRQRVHPAFQMMYLVSHVQFPV